MRYAYTVEECRAADRAAQLHDPEAVLIDRASAAVARRAAAMLGFVYGARVVVLAGGGHNGADALWAGVKLQQRGARVDVVMTGAPRDEHGAEPLRLLRAAGAHDAPREHLQDCDLVIDGLVGIGFTGMLRSPERAAAARAAALVLSVDVPSGVDSDTGAVAGVAVRADVTVTFGGLKPGLLVDPGAGYAGQIEVADVGLTQHLPATSRVRVLDADDVGAAFPTPPRESSKYTRGVVGIVAGSELYAGAAVLCCGGALAAGAGMVQLYADRAVGDLARTAYPEVVLSAAEAARLSGNDKARAWVIGPGLGTGERAEELLRAALLTDLPVLLDADAVTLAARTPVLLRRAAATVVTPHVGEFVRLAGGTADDVRADRLGAATRLSRELGVTVLLKGTTTVVASPDGTAYVNPTGTPWLATAGTGDVLSGVIGSLLAAGMPAAEAAAAGAWVHGLAGRLASERDGGAVPIVAGDVVQSLPAAIRSTRG